MVKCLDMMKASNWDILVVKSFCTILGNVDKITLWLDIGTELGFLDGSFDGSNEGKLDVLFIGDSLGYTDVKVLVSDEGTVRAGFTWSVVHVVVVGWIFGRVGYHATSKGAELSCEIYYTISFWSWFAPSC